MGKTIWKNIRAVMGYVVFSCLLFSLLAKTNWVMDSKWVERQRCCPPASQREFYALPRNSLDVLFLGTSHSIYSFSPQILYDEAGLSSYNLGSAAQPVVMSRYWLEEAFKYQKPKVVVLETFGFHWDELNTGFARIAATGMRWSPTKVAALMDVANEADEDPLGYVFSNMKFHDRWASLQQDDFTGTMYAEELRGYVPTFWSNGGDGFETVSEESDAESTKLPIHARRALDRICDLCYMNDARLVLITIPSKEWTQGDHNMVDEYVSGKQGVEFYDLNCTERYAELGYDYWVDSSDGNGHANVDGATKLTKWVGTLLSQDRYGMRGHKDELMDGNVAYWRQLLQEKETYQETDPKEYAKRIDLSNHVVFVSCPKNTSEDIRSMLNQWMRDLGLEAPQDGKFVAVVTAMDEEGTISNASGDSLLGILENGMVTYQLGCSDDNGTILLSSGEGVNVNQIPDGVGEWPTGPVVVVYDPVHQVASDKVLLTENPEGTGLEIRHI